MRTYDGAARLLGDSELPSCRCLVVDYAAEWLGASEAGTVPDRGDRALAAT